MAGFNYPMPDRTSISVCWRHEYEYRTKADWSWVKLNVKWPDLSKHPVLNMTKEEIDARGASRPAGVTEYPRAGDIALAISSLPEDMLRSHANAVITERGLTPRDLLYILAGYELAKPRVHHAVVSEQIETSEAVG